MSYNLNDNVNEDFEFTLDDRAYKMRYPTIDELDKLRERINKQDIQEEEVTGFMFSFITAIDPTTPDISSALKKKNVKVLANFKNMIRVELGLDG